MGIFTQSEIVEYVKSKPLSKMSLKEQVMEGVVATPAPELNFPFGDPVKWKLKCKEF